MRVSHLRLVRTWLRGKRHPDSPPFGGLAGVWVQLYFNLAPFRRRR